LSSVQDFRPETPWLEFVKNLRKRFRKEADLLQNRQHFRFTRRQARSASGVS